METYYGDYMQLLESKSLLAKLMAAENLTIEQRNVSTAGFNVKTRVLVVPILDKNINSHTYDLFMGHEVGHALYTPMEGIIKGKELKISHGILNVVEDSRIERKIKYKYPGLRLSFVRAYKELVDKNFFETQGRNLNDMNFIDRINLHCKGGAILGIKFNQEERALLNDVETTETYDDVIEVSARIQQYMKDLKEKQKEMEMAEDALTEKEEGSSGDNYSDFGEFEESDDSEEDDGTLSDDVEGDGLDDEVSENGNEQSTGSTGHGDYSEDEIRSYTDEAYKENEQKLFDQGDIQYEYANIPKVDLKKAVFDYKALYKLYKETHADCIDREGFQKIRKETNKAVSYLAKEFEMRKNAEQLKRASTAKTGDLDMKKIYSYGFNEDIFKKLSVVPNGKSHGLILFLDWSGSMSQHIGNTVKQLISLVMFCKKVNIPYEVYAFAETERNDGGYTNEFVVNDLILRHYRLNNLLSSRMSAGDFSYAASALVMLSHSRRYGPSWMSMGSTPLNEAVISAMEIIPKFQQENKLQIVNTVFLTDGEGHITRSRFEICPMTNTKTEKTITSHSWSSNRRTRLVVKDTKTQNEEVIEDCNQSEQNTAAFVKLLKARTGCNVLGFYVLSGRDFGKYCWKWYPRGADIAQIKTDFRKNKYTILNSSGFDEYYLLRSEGLDTEEENEFIVKENASTRGLVSAFTKYTGNKHGSRVVLNRFIGMIS
jgi:hypothetical protein